MGDFYQSVSPFSKNVTFEEIELMFIFCVLLCFVIE